MDTPKKPPLGFMKTTLLGGMLVVVPIGIIGFALWQVIALTRDLLGPVFDKLPFDSAMIRVFVIVAAVLLVVLLCYFTGVLVRTRWGKRLRDWIEQRLLDKIPGYKIVRSLANQYLDDEEEQKFRPVLVDLHGLGSRMIGFAIEEVGDGSMAIYIPSVPAVTLGGLHFVPAERVSPLPASMHATVETLTMFGEGSAALLSGPSANE